MQKIVVLQQVYFMPLHVSSTCAHHQEVKIITPIGGRLVYRLREEWFFNVWVCMCGFGNVWVFW